MRILFAGGGTAGHINPALAIYDYIFGREPSEAAFVGTREGLEAELIPRLGFELSFIKIHGFERSLNLQNIKNIFELPKSISDSKKIIRRFKPDIVIGTGGYVAGPVVYAAARMGIPTMVHESNAFPGVTTRLLSGCADVIAVGAKPAAEYLKKAKRILYTGNPVRPSILSADPFAARRELGLDSRPFIVCFGGSLGARDFNAAVAEWIAAAAPGHRYQIMMGTGKNNQYGAVAARFKELGFDPASCSDVTVSEYIYNMDTVMAAADLIVCRAGASTLGELAALGKPSVLVPSPYVTANHQEHNARAVEREGGAVVVPESELGSGRLAEVIDSLAYDRDKLARMRKGARASGTVRAAEMIYDEACRLIAKKQNK